MYVESPWHGSMRPLMCVVCQDCLEIDHILLKHVIVGGGRWRCICADCGGSRGL